MYRISRILLKYFTFGTNDEESRQLEQWKGESDRNEHLFQKIGSHDFLEQAMDPIHKQVLEEQWNLLQKKRMVINRRRITRRISWAAAIIIPFIFVVLHMYSPEKSIERIYLGENYAPANSKAIIHLAKGERIVVYQDTIFQKEMTTGFVKNHRDTVAFLPKDKEGASIEMYQVEVPRGGEYVARLEDGTTIHLDADSKLVIPQKFGNDKREVKLTGHAYFSVEKDSLRPFIVKAGDVSIKVLGTEFDLSSYKDQEMSTTLVKGAVEIYNSQSKCKLKPNQQAKIRNDGEIIVSDVDVYPFIAWKEERIVFINKPLEFIMQVLERWYDVKSIFLSPEIRQECFTLDMEKYGEIDAVLKSIEKTEKVYFNVNGKQVTVHKK